MRRDLSLDLSAPSAENTQLGPAIDQGRSACEEEDESMVPPHYLDAEGIRTRTALVMPQWFAADIDADRVDQVLRANLAGVDTYVLPERVCLVVDACPAAEAAVTDLNAQRAADGLEPYVVVVNDENLGQGGSLTRAFDELLRRGCKADWWITRDADGDHFINDLPHLARLACEMTTATDADYLMVIGRRINVHRPMTWLRGELEELINRTMMAALAYRLARRGQVIDRRFMHPDALLPDTQSGYKLYTPELIRRVVEEYARFRKPPWRPDTFRYLGQVAPFWVCIDAGGVCGEVMRASLTDQTVSSFGPDTFRRQYRAKLHYVLKRSDLPGPVASQILANSILRSALWTHPDGQALSRWFWQDLSDELDLGPNDRLLDPMFR